MIGIIISFPNIEIQSSTTNGVVNSICGILRFENIFPNPNLLLEMVFPVLLFFLS